MADENFLEGFLGWMADMIESVGGDPENPQDVANFISRPAMGPHSGPMEKPLMLKEEGFGAGAGPRPMISGPAPMGEQGLSDSFGGRSPRGTADPTKHGIAEEATRNADVAGLPLPAPESGVPAKPRTRQTSAPGGGHTRRTPSPQPQETGTKGPETTGGESEEQQTAQALQGLAKLVLEPRQPAPPPRTAGNAPLIGLPQQQTPVQPLTPFSNLRNL